jgi:predicted nucleotidyltransferase
MTSLQAIQNKREAVLAIAEAYQAKHVRVFGSVARGEDADGSDIDLLVAFGPDASLFRHAALERELSTLLGTQVDVVSDRGLRPDVRDLIESEAIPL